MQSKRNDEDHLKWEHNKHPVKNFILRMNYLFYNGKTHVPFRSGQGLMDRFHLHSSVHLHQEYMRLRYLMKNRYFWPGMGRDVQMFVHFCESCNKAKNYLANIPRS